MKKIVLVAILLLSGMSVIAKECATGYACSIEELNKKSAVQKEQQAKKITPQKDLKEKIKAVKKSVNNPVPAKEHNPQSP